MKSQHKIENRDIEKERERERKREREKERERDGVTLVRL